jgi:hypothetical protein
MLLIYEHLLMSKNYRGDIEDGVQILLRKTDSSIHYAHFLDSYLQTRANREMLLHLSLNVDMNKSVTLMLSMKIN